MSVLSVSKIPPDRFDRFDRFDLFKFLSCTFCTFALSKFALRPYRDFETLLYLFLLDFTCSLFYFTCSFFIQLVPFLSSKGTTLPFTLCLFYLPCVFLTQNFSQKRHDPRSLVNSFNVHPFTFLCFSKLAG